VLGAGGSSKLLAVLLALNYGQLVHLFSVLEVLLADNWRDVHDDTIRHGSPAWSRPSAPLGAGWAAHVRLTGDTVKVRRLCHMTVICSRRVLLHLPHSAGLCLTKLASATHGQPLALVLVLMLVPQCCLPASGGAAGACCLPAMGLLGGACVHLWPWWWLM
jgi:hypothetical protein